MIFRARKELTVELTPEQQEYIRDSYVRVRHLEENRLGLSKLLNACESEAIDVSDDGASSTKNKKYKTDTKKKLEKISHLWVSLPHSIKYIISAYALNDIGNRLSIDLFQGIDPIEEEGEVVSLFCFDRYILDTIQIITSKAGNYSGQDFAEQLAIRMLLDVWEPIMGRVPFRTVAEILDEDKGRKSRARLFCEFCVPILIKIDPSKNRVLRDEPSQWAALEKTVLGRTARHLRMIHELSRKSR